MVPPPKTQLGTTGYEITRVGLGAWAIGGGGWQGGWGSQNDLDSIGAIRHAIDCGVNWIDTAPAYGLGHAEEVVGRALADVPEADRPFIFTKCGLVWEPGGTSVSNVLAPASIRRECEASLKRLRVERLDLLQIHWPATDGTPIEESWATMGDLVDEGKVRAIGVSNFDLELLERCELVRHVDTFQPELNLIARSAVESIAWCAQRNIGVLVYSPMRSGLLTGRFSIERAENLPVDDWRREHEDFRPPKLEQHLALVSKLAREADEVGVTLPELAVAWALAWPGVTAAIVGARRPAQIDGWLRGAALELDEEQLERIFALIDETEAGDGPCRPAVEAAA
jgi:aryl-alcohol dehydrogenase-like predicted oxidoreductase